MKLICKHIFLILFSIAISSSSDIYDILDNSFNRLKSYDIRFDCDLKIQSISKDPTELKFSFISHWSDSLNFYSYLKFLSPVDFKNTEIWSHHSEKVIVKRRMPLNNEIVTIDDDLEGLDIISFLNFDDIFNQIKKDEVSLKKSKFNKQDVFVIKSFKTKNKRKVMKFYISKDDFRILKIEWTNKRGALNKILTFENWEFVKNVKISKSIIFEDIKKGAKTTCNLSNLSLEKLSNKKIKLIRLGFEN